MSAQAHGYRTYWLIWAILLVATVVMIVIGDAELATSTQAVLLLFGSALKASLIVFYFNTDVYHKRYDITFLIQYR